MLRRLPMHTFHLISKLQQSSNLWMKKQLRRVGIFWRLNLSFLLLLLTSSLFLTFFSFHQYSTEINLRLDRYVSLLVQNVELKAADTMKTYEDIALRFYDDARVLAAVSENARIGSPADAEEAALTEQNTRMIEYKLYTMSQNRKYIENVQFVTPGRQYRMVEENGFVLYYTDQCPYTYYWVPKVQEAAKEHGIPFKAVHITEKETAQNVPAPVTTYALFRDGKFVTQSIQTDKKFLK